MLIKLGEVNGVKLQTRQGVVFLKVGRIRKSKEVISSIRAVFNSG